jgi:hypothetical protein
VNITHQNKHVTRTLHAVHNSLYHLSDWSKLICIILFFFRLFVDN